MPKNSYPGTRFNATMSGWSEELVFFDWLQLHFIPNVKSVTRPILLIMDGRRSHLSTRIIKCAMDNGIHIECLPPHSTTILQPLDVLTLSKLKRSWKKLLSDHYRKTNSESLTKQTFTLLVSYILLFNKSDDISLFRYQSCLKIIYYLAIVLEVSQKLVSIHLINAVYPKRNFFSLFQHQTLMKRLLE